jgi:hypothetical protein
MTRDAAFEKLSTAIEALPAGSRQAVAHAALSHLLKKLERRARMDAIQEARNDLLAVLPGHEAAVDRILVEQVLYPTMPRFDHVN